MKLFALDGRVFDQVPVGADHDGCLDDDGYCCGCRKNTGSAHDHGCDWEPCPRCGGQFIACNCDANEWPGYSEADAREIVDTLTAALKEHTS